MYGLVTLTTNGALRDVIVRFSPQGVPGVFFDARSSTMATVAPDAGQENYTTSQSTTDQTNAPAVNLPAATYNITVLGLNGQPDPRFSGFTVSGGATVTVAGGDQQRKNNCWFRLRQGGHHVIQRRSLHVHVGFMPHQGRCNLILGELL